MTTGHVKIAIHNNTFSESAYEFAALLALEICFATAHLSYHAFSSVRDGKIDLRVGTVMLVLTEIESPDSRKSHQGNTFSSRLHSKIFSSIFQSLWPLA